MPINFLNPTKTDAVGLVGVSKEITPAHLRRAYSSGIFPWPQDGIDEYLWFCPDPRGLLFVDETRWSKSFLKWRKMTRWRVTFNQDFLRVMRLCAEQKRPGQVGTWIRDEMYEAYETLFRTGEAYSVETWDENNELVGGLYGVIMKGVVAGESMFFRRPNASKLALAELVDVCRTLSIPWIDTQMVTDFIRSIGGRYVPRSEFLDLLVANQNQLDHHSILSKR